MDKELEARLDQIQQKLQTIITEYQNLKNEVDKQEEIFVGVVLHFHITAYPDGNTVLPFICVDISTDNFSISSSSNGKTPLSLIISKGNTLAKDTPFLHSPTNIREPPCI